MSRNTVDAGRLKIQAPEFGYDVEDGGISLYNVLHNIFTFVGDNTVVRWYSISLAASGFPNDSVTLHHNFSTPLSKLKITFTQNGDVLSSAQVQNLLEITSSNDNSITVRNISSQNLQLHCYIGATKGRITADDFDATYYDQIVERTKAQQLSNKSCTNLRLLSQTAETGLPSNSLAIANVSNKLTTSFTREGQNSSLVLASIPDVFVMRNFVRNAKAEHLLTQDIVIGPNANSIAFASSNVLVDNTAFVFVPKAVKTVDTYVRFLLRNIDPFYADKTLIFSIKTYTTVANKYKVKLVNITDNVVVSGTEQILDSGFQLVRVELQSYLSPAKSYAIQIEQLTDGATGELYFNDLFVGDLLGGSGPSGGGQVQQDDYVLLSNNSKARIKNPYQTKTTQAKVQLSAFGSDLAQIANDYKAVGYHAVVFTPQDTLPTLPNVTGIVVASGMRAVYDFGTVYQLFGNSAKDNTITNIIDATRYYSQNAIASVDTQTVKQDALSEALAPSGTQALDIASIHKQIISARNWLYIYDDYDGVDSNKFNKFYVSAFVNSVTSASEIVDSIRNGNCYLSTGVTLNSIEILNKKIISVVANENCTFYVYADGKLVSQSFGTSVQYEVNDFSATYYLVYAINAQNKVAITQPFFIERSDFVLEKQPQVLNKNRSFTHPSVFHYNEIDISYSAAAGRTVHIMPFWYHVLTAAGHKLRIENGNELKVTNAASSITQLTLYNRTALSGINRTFTCNVELKRTTAFTSGSVELVIIATYTDGTSTTYARAISQSELSTSEYRIFSLSCTTHATKNLERIDCGIRYLASSMPNANAVFYVRNCCLYSGYTLNQICEPDYRSIEAEIPSGKNLALNASYEYRPIQDSRDVSSIQNHVLSLWTTAPYCFGFVKPNYSRVVITHPLPGIWQQVNESVSSGTFGPGFYYAIPSLIARGLSLTNLLYYRVNHSITGSVTGALNYSTNSLIFKYNNSAVDGINRGNNANITLTYTLPLADGRFEFTVPLFLLFKAFNGEIWRGFGIELYLRTSNTTAQNITTTFNYPVCYEFDGNYYLHRYVPQEEGRAEVAYLYETCLPSSQKIWTTGIWPNSSIYATYSIFNRTGNSAYYAAALRFVREKIGENAGLTLFATDRGTTNRAREHVPGNFVTREASIAFVHRDGHMEIYCPTSTVAMISANWEYDRC